jgi:hypothetical protein
MPELLRQVALISESTAVALPDLMQCSAAIQKQASRDFAPLWDVDATVDAFAKLDDVPLGYWRVLIVDADPRLPDSALGVHLDDNNQPFALVKVTANWQLTCSHETLEMLADPYGNRLTAGDSPKADQGRVQFLVEVSDPSEAAEFGYTVNGLTMSDFYTPNYFDPVQSTGVRYSFTGAITEPRQVLRGGYLSWHDPATNDWWQEQYFGAQSQFIRLGPLDGQRSLRAQIERKTNVQSSRSMVQNRAALLSAAQSFGPMVARPSQANAAALRSFIERLKTGGGPPPPGGGGGGPGYPPPAGPAGRRPTPRPGR